MGQVPRVALGIVPADYSEEAEEVEYGRSYEGAGRVASVHDEDKGDGEEEDDSEYADAIGAIPLPLLPRVGINLVSTGTGVTAISSTAADSARAALAAVGYMGTGALYFAGRAAVASAACLGSIAGVVVRTAGDVAAVTAKRRRGLRRPLRGRVGSGTAVGGLQQGGGGRLAAAAAPATAAGTASPAGSGVPGGLADAVDRVVEEEPVAAAAGSTQVRQPQEQQQRVVAGEDAVQASSPAAGYEGDSSGLLEAGDDAAAQRRGSAVRSASAAGGAAPAAAAAPAAVAPSALMRAVSGAAALAAWPVAGPARAVSGVLFGWSSPGGAEASTRGAAAEHGHEVRKCQVGVCKVLLYVRCLLGRALWC